MNDHTRAVRRPTIAPLVPAIPGLAWTETRAAAVELARHCRPALPNPRPNRLRNIPKPRHLLPLPIRVGKLLQGIHTRHFTLFSISCNAASHGVLRLTNPTAQCLQRRKSILFGLT